MGLGGDFLKERVSSLVATLTALGILSVFSFIILRLISHK